MRIVAAFLLLTVFGALAFFLTFTSSWGSLLMPHTAANDGAAVVEEPAPTLDWEGKYAVAVNQPIVLRSAPFAAAQTVGFLHKGERVALQGCDASGLWCRTEAGAWLVSYRVGTLPEGLPTLQGVSVQAAPTQTPLLPTPAPALLLPTPTQAPAIRLLPTPTPVSTALPQAIVSEAANLRAGPGTTYAIVGSANFGESLSLVGQSADGQWYQTGSGVWIAAFLLREPPAGLPIADAPADQPGVEGGQMAEPDATSDVSSATEILGTTAAPAEAGMQGAGRVP